MPSLRLVDLPDNNSHLVGWKQPSWILASLFLNLFFWYEPAGDFYFLGPPLVYFGWLAVLPVLIVGLFFMGPALASHSSRRSLFLVLSEPFGVILANLLSALTALLALLWILGSAGSIATAFLRFGFTLSDATRTVLVASLMIFLLLTGMQRIDTNARLANFTNKLGIALLIVAALRVRAYIPIAWNDLYGGPAENAWLAIVQPLMIVGPMALMAADFGRRARTRRDVFLMGIFGLAIPLTATLFAVSLVQRAAYRWRSDLGGSANILLALWGEDSVRFVRWWMLAAVITTFGVARFGARISDEALSETIKNRRIRVGILILVLVAGAVGINRPTTNLLSWMEEASCLAASVAAILTAHYFSRSDIIGTARQINVTGLLSIVSGCLMAAEEFPDPNGADYSTHLLAAIATAYASSFLIFIVTCLAVRVLRRSVGSAKT